MSWTAIRPAFEWIVTDDAGGNVFAWIRKGNDARARCLVVVNFSPMCITTTVSGVPFAGKWREGSQFGPPRIMAAAMSGMSAKVQTLDGLVPELNLTIPPLAAIFLVPES